MIIGLSLLVALLGLVVYLITTKPKVEALALKSFFAGLLVFLFQAREVISLLLG